MPTYADSTPPKSHQLARFLKPTEQLFLGKRCGDQEEFLLNAANNRRLVTSKPPLKSSASVLVFIASKTVAGEWRPDLPNADSPSITVMEFGAVGFARARQECCCTLSDVRLRQSQHLQRRNFIEECSSPVGIESGLQGCQDEFIDSQRTIKRMLA